ncbi:SEC-C metal-binding domain-containing protein [Yersinia enterocolitica]
MLINSLDGIKFVEVTPRSKKVKRNEQCPCGSEIKYKLCHGRN